MSLMEAMSGTPNLSQPLPWLITCGQPSLQQFKAAQSEGVTVVIDLRDPMEPRPLEEATELAALGMKYINIPVVSGALDDETLDLIIESLRANAGQLTILHCASANRVGGALIPYLVLDEKHDEQAAVQTAMQVGMRSAELMEWGTDYARRQLG
jgi:protein tyrosine phosphatase (PTP) superfamily phosphohydrolase (DUF442 family)